MVDVTATIVDLAVRGHLRIVELERRTGSPPATGGWRKLTGGTGELLPFERELYNGLFLSGDRCCSRR